MAKGDDLQIDVGARIAGLERQLARAVAVADKSFSVIERRSSQSARRVEINMTRSASRVNESVSALGTSLGSFGKGLIGGAIGAVSFDALVNGAKSSVAALAKIQDTADRTGVSTDLLQQLGYAVEQSGGEAEDAAAGMQKFAIQVSKAAAGGGDLAKILAANGVAAKDSTGAVRPLGDLLNDVADLIANASSEADKLNIATAAFGRAGGPAMVLALSGGKAGLADFARQATAAGVVLDKSLIQKAAATDDELAKLSAQLSGLGRQIAAEFGGPIVVDAMRDTLDFLRQIRFTIDAIRRGDLKDAIGLYDINTPEGRAGLAGSLIRGGSSRVSPPLTAGDLTTYYDRTGAGRGAHPDVTVSKPTIVPSETTTKAPKVDDSVYATALKYSGWSEKANDAQIRELLSKTGRTFSGDLRVWCADFVNAVLAQRGIKGTGSRSARSFMNFGEATNSPSKGDIVVLKRGKEGSGSGHVGFFEGYDDTGRVKVLGGNQSEGINHQTYDSSRILGFRKQPEAGQDVTARLKGDSSVGDALKEADARIDALRREADATNQSAYAKAFAAEKARLLADVERDGVAASPEQIAQIDAASAAYAAQSVATDRLAASAKDLKRAREDLGSLGADATKGFIADMKAGKTAAEALSNALDKIVTKLTDNLIDSLFSGLFGASKTGGGGGLLGSIGSLFGFADGGYTGDGGKNEPKGVVHGGEYVFSKDATKRLGKGNLEALHRKAKGYASGGYVGAAVPAAIPRVAVPVARAPTSRISPQVKMTVDLKGANGDAQIERVARQAATQAGRQAYQEAVAASDKRVQGNQQFFNKHGHART